MWLAWFIKEYKNVIQGHQNASRVFNIPQELQILRRNKNIPGWPWPVLTLQKHRLPYLQDRFWITKLELPKYFSLTTSLEWMEIHFSLIQSQGQIVKENVHWSRALALIFRKWVVPSLALQHLFWKSYF